MRNWMAVVFAGMATLMAAGSTVQAQTDFKCFASSGSEDLEPWRVGCIGTDWIYGVVDVTPSGEEGGSLYIHITDHQDCPYDAHLECAISADLVTGTCLPEGKFDTTYEGFLGSMSIYCGCYTAENPCDVSGDAQASSLRYKAAP